MAMDLTSVSMPSIQSEYGGNSVLPDNPVPLSFPALLRNPGISDRFAHLHGVARGQSSPIPVAKKNKRDEHEGKRWIRRRENAKFVGNPHIVLATKKDYVLPSPHVRSTFPEPLPSYLPRTANVPPITPPALDPTTANAGRFSLSLKGMRRELRKSGAQTEALVRDVEDEIVRWLEGGTILTPDDGDALNFPGVPVGSTDVIREVSHTPLQLVWSIAENSFARYVVHCCARYYEVVSFSKVYSGQRLTYLLRPNVTRPDFHTRASLDTPPVTDLESSSPEFDTESDLVSETGDSDAELRGPPGTLSAISEDVPSVRGVSPSALHPASEDGWSVIGGGSDAEGEESGSERDLPDSLESLSLNETDRTPRAFPYIRQTSLRPRVWDHRQGRSASSPSRSPARRPRRMPPRFDPPPTTKAKPKSFYDFLFA